MARVPRRLRSCRRAKTSLQCEEFQVVVCEDAGGCSSFAPEGECEGCGTCSELVFEDSEGRGFCRGCFEDLERWWNGAEG
jgi:hypothetical protein